MSRRPAALTLGLPATTSQVLALLLLLLVVCGAGCSRVERTLQVTSEPPGALVYLNGQEVGRTPMNKTFIWYGTYDVQLRKEGYKTVSAKEKVWAPWWQVPPIDLIADLVPAPLHDQHKLAYTLTPQSDEAGDAQELMARGERLRGQLQGSQEKSTREKQDAALRGDVPAGEPARAD